MTKSWFSFKNLAPDPSAPESPEVEISIYDEIGFWGVRGSDFIAAAKPYAGKRILCRINSPGGDVFDGLAIYNWLRGQDCTVQIDGLAASIASVIALAGKTVCIAENGFFMVHNPMGCALGDAEDMRETADALEKIGASLAGTYARETGQTPEVCQAWMDDETWFSAEEAVKAGLADKCGPQMSFSASLGRFANPPSALLGGAAGATNKPAGKNDTMQNLFKALHAAGIIAKLDLDEGAAAGEITTAFTALRTERDEFKAKLDAITEKENLSAIEAAIADGRINAKSKDQWIARAKTDPSAITMLASINKPGAENPPLNREGSGGGVNEIVAQWNAITDPKQKTAFYNKHRAALLAAA